MSEYELKIRIALEDTAGDKPRDGHAEVELTRQNHRQLIIVHQAVPLRGHRGMHEDRQPQFFHQFVKRRKLFGIERQSVNLRRYRYTLQFKLPGGALQLSQTRFL